MAYDDPYKRIPLRDMPGRPIITEGDTSGIGPAPVRTIYTLPNTSGTNIPVSQEPGISQDTAIYSRDARMIDAANPYQMPVEVIRGNRISREYPASSMNAPASTGPKYRFVGSDWPQLEQMYGEDLMRTYDALRSTGVDSQKALAYIDGFREKRNEFRQKMEFEREKAMFKEQSKEKQPDYRNFKTELNKKDKSNNRIYNTVDSVQSLGEQYRIPQDIIDKEILARRRGMITGGYEGEPMQMGGKGQPAPTTPTAPAPTDPRQMSVQEYVDYMRPYVPDATDQDLADYYFLNYGNEIQ